MKFAPEELSTNYKDPRSTTGQRFISVRPDGRYRVHLRIRDFPVVNRCFVDLEDAIRFRDDQLHEWRMLIRYED